MNVQGVANFLDDLMGGLQLISLAVLVGSLLWAFVVLRIGRDASRVERAVLERCIALLRTGAIALTAFQALKLVTKAAVLASSLGELPWGAYAGTLQFRAGTVQMALALAVWFVARQLSRRPANMMGWGTATGLTIALLVTGAWLVHGVGRFEDRGWLMSLTVVHELAAAVWVGGVLQLLALWRLSGHDDRARTFWPVAVTRFSALGIGAVGVLVATGVALALKYVGSWNGAFGTGYGSLVVAKVLLLVVTLGFAGLNFFAGRDWRRDARSSAVTARVPYFVEAETFLLVSLLFVAASLSSMPPAVDIPNLTATVPEVLDMFRPKLPSLSSPTHQALLAGEPGRIAIVGRVPSVAATDWSDYNHNVAGVLLVAMGLFALLSYVRGFGWARYWPVGFMLLGVFLFFRSDAESWPLGPIGFWDSTFGNGEVLQHRTATLLAFTLGALETRARISPRPSNRLRFMFPTLCAFGGILLVTHAHLPFEIKNDYLIQSTHLVMGLLAAILATGRWLELRLADTGDGMTARVAGLVAVSAMLMIGAILIFYKEPLY